MLFEGIGDGHVEPAVVVEVGGDRRDLRRGGGDLLGGTERPAAQVEQHGDVAGLVVGHGDIGLAVAVEVGDGQVRTASTPRGA